MGAVHLSVRLSVSLSVYRQNAKNAIFSKTKQFRAVMSIDDLQPTGSYVILTGLFKEPIIGSLQSKMAEIRHLENGHDVIFFCRGWSDLDKISQTGTEWHLDCGDVWKWKSAVEFQYGGRLGEFNGMSSQSHVSHCRVLPLGEFTVTISDLHATLQCAVTWRNQCRDRATLQGVRIPSGILKIVFRYILFIFVFNAV